MKKKIGFILVIVITLFTICNYTYKSSIIKNNSNKYLLENTSYITEEDYINLGIERAYVVGNYLFDISNNFNPSLKDLLVAASYLNIDAVSIYELKISTNIHGDVVKEYIELLDNVKLDAFPEIKIKYIFDSSTSFSDVNPGLELKYKEADSLQLTEADFKALNVGRAYLIGDYLFDLDNGFNPTLKDLLIASTTSYTNDLKVYELKISENIHGNIIEEYSELLSGNSLDKFPNINCKYVYDKNIVNNDPKNVLTFKDTLEFTNLLKSYRVDGVVVNEAKSKNNLNVEYEYFKNTDCSGDKLSKITEIGTYGVLAKTSSTTNILGTSKCVKLDVIYDDLNTNSYYIEPENAISSEKLISVYKSDALTESNSGVTYWSNEMEYDNTSIDLKGKSRFTVKVDKGLVQDVKATYDITIDYYDKGDGIIFMQSSSTDNNQIDYRGNGYGSYVEEGYFSWGSRSFYVKNLSFGLTDTGSWKQYTFNVTDEFFDKGKDNYIHFYFGKQSDNNEYDYIKVKKITVTKRSFFIETADKNNSKVAGNVYTKDDFGMGFSIKNILKNDKTVNLSYEVVDSNNNIVYGKDLGFVDIESLKSNKYYLTEFNDLDLYGAFNLKVKAVYDDTTEIEVIQFSKIVSDMTNDYNDFMAMNINLGYSAWANDTDITDSLKLSKMLGVNNLRYGILPNSVHADINGNGYTNSLGRYEFIYDNLLKNYNQNVLPVVWNARTQVFVNDDGSLTSESFDALKAEAIDYYSRFASVYGDYFTYYELYNEWNNGSPGKAVSAEEYAEIVVEVSKAIKEIDSDAKIVALASGDDIWCSSNYCSYYSPTEAGHQQFVEDSWMARVLKTKWEDEDGNLQPFLNFIDVVSIHLYPYNFKKSLEENYYVERMKEVRKVIEFYNEDNKDIPIWFSETGFHNAEKIGQSLEKHASNTLRTFIYGYANKKSNAIIDEFDPIKIERIYLYTFQDEARYNFDGEANFGIVASYDSNVRKPFTRDVSMYAKPAYVALNMFNYMLNGAELTYTYLQDSAYNEPYYVYRFLNHSSNIEVLWTDNEDITYQVSEYDDIYDMYGNVVTPLKNDNDEYYINIGYNPVYIVSRK